MVNIHGNCQHNTLCMVHISYRFILRTLKCFVLVLNNSLWPGDAIWRQGFGSTLAQVMACCLTAPSHYLNQCWLIISEAQWHSLWQFYKRCLYHQSLKSVWKMHVWNFIQISQGPMSWWDANKCVGIFEYEDQLFRYRDSHYKGRISYSDLNRISNNAMLESQHGHNGTNLCHHIESATWSIWFSDEPVKNNSYFHNYGYNVMLNKWLLTHEQWQTHGYVLNTAATDTLAIWSATTVLTEYSLY